MLFVGIILFSYVVYIMYIYDFMYMKDSINKILNFIKYGKFDITPKNVPIIKQFRKKWEANDDGCLDKLIADFGNQKEAVSNDEDVTAEE